MSILLHFHRGLDYKSDVSKHFCFSLLFIISIVSLTMAQDGSGLGIKGGINYNGNGDYFNSISNTSEDPMRAVGYHFGLFGKIGNILYLKPELIYTKTKSDYSRGELNLQRIDAPILLGLKVLGPFSVFAGPAFQYILDSELVGANLESIENDFTIGLNFGIGFNLNNIGIDLRYERSFNENEAKIVTTNNSIAIGRLDIRPEQLILSFSVKL
ncbi:outer membrane beta-barrel protein [Lacinutrix neustonica]|uniref:Outer membrane beta-barrel protein n=1 Tax=Lacinutrix neustonica TaxID=2980107 RepID=A0A9E8SD36_9FLAO|nr:outer membrane beta-barrel protein [Lacinutrix neustonica]WAC02013.1 outer membrane beta-barrel protein [Lacinutrix neustonica]